MELMKFLGFFAILVSTAVHPIQSTKPLGMHGIRPGMLTREIILHSQAVLDTTVWGGADGQSTIGFKGEYLLDTGEFRIYVTGPEITQITFIAKQRPIADNTMSFNREMDEIRKIDGRPIQDYHNKYRIVSWQSGGLQLNLTTADSGKFYSVSLSEPLIKTH